MMFSDSCPSWNMSHVTSLSAASAVSGPSSSRRLKRNAAMGHVDIAPMAFMSYSRLDDSRGYIRDLCRYLTHEIQAEVGAANFKVFFDKDSIEWGDAWR